MNVMIASQLTIILLSFYFIFRALMKMPKPVMITMWSIIGVLIIAIIITGVYFPENLLSLQEKLEGFKNTIQGS